MVLGVMEGQIRGGYFPDSILDPSVVDPTVEGTLLRSSKLELGNLDILTIAGSCRGLEARWR